MASGLSNAVGQVAPAPVIPDGKKKKRPYKRKDPDAPKKPLTSFFAYSAYERPKIRLEREKAGSQAVTNGDLTTLVAEAWKNMKPEEKKKWTDKYERELAVYRQKKAAYIAGKDKVVEQPVVVSKSVVVAESTEQSESESGSESESESDSESESVSGSEESESELETDVVFTQGPKGSTKRKAEGKYKQSSKKSTAQSKSKKQKN